MLTIFACSTASPAATLETIYSKMINDTVNIVITCEVNDDKTLLLPLLTKRVQESVKGSKTVKVELRQQNKPAVLLAMKQLLVTDAVGARVDVVDVSLLDGNVVIPVTVDTNLFLWRIRLTADNGDGWQPLNGWEVLAEATPLDRKSVKVVLDILPNRTLSVTVSDLRISPAAPRPITFSQQQGRWAFDRKQR